MNYKYCFSVIISAYNVEQYIDECLSSIINQDIGFDNVQVIIVNDGSKDNTLNIINKYRDQYPNNIEVINKENSGVSDSRNVALSHVEGKYVAFLDSDDKYDLDTLKKVYEFFEKNYDKVDIISIPIYYFDGKNGDHILNYKFDEGTRIIDINKNPEIIQMSVIGTFIKSSVLVGKYHFDTNLKYSEDAKIIQILLLDGNVLGLLSNTRYYYRVRSGDDQSAIQGGINSRYWYNPVVDNFYKYIIDKSLKHKGVITKNVQNTILYDVSYKLRMMKIPAGVLTDDEEKNFIKETNNVLNQLDSECIVDNKYIEPSIKYAILKNRDNFSHDINNNKIYSVDKDMEVELSFVDVIDNKCLFQGRLFSMVDMKSELIVKTNEDKYTAELVFMDKQKSYFFGTLNNQYSFEIAIPLTGHTSFKFYLDYGTKTLEIKNIVFGNFFPLSNRYDKMYFIREPYLFYQKDCTIFCIKASLFNKIKFEVSYLFQLLADRSTENNIHNAAIKAAIVRPLVSVCRLFKRKPIWLFMDRINYADDNGEALYEYVTKNVKNNKSYFILSKQSSDYARLCNIGNVIDYFSWKYKILYLISDIMFSSSADEEMYGPFKGHKEPYKDLLSDIKLVFLQHGVTQNNISDWLNRYNKNLSKIIVSSQMEKESFSNFHYYYDQENILLTGMPRYDRLQSKPEKIITIAPTWRQYLVGRRSDDGLMTRRNEFYTSDYYRNYNGLINDKELLSVLKKHGYRLQLVLHPMFRAYEDSFLTENNIEIVTDKTYNQIFKESSLLITDYSSVAFDFAYLTKPVIYFQYDYDSFYKNHTLDKGYFSYVDNGFGEVEYDLNSLIKRIIEYIENDCKMKEVYVDRVKTFFYYNDRNNCKRIIDIMSKKVI